MTSAMLEAALSYRDLGFSVIPFHPRSKKPAFGKGEIRPYRRKWASVAQIRRWFARTDYNVGMITGSISQLLVLDIDGEAGEQSANGLPMPPTPMVITPRPGRQMYFRSPDRPIKTAIRALPGIDILSENWQIVAPPSVRPKGCYEWHDHLAIADIAMSPPPAWVIDLAQTPIPKTDDTRAREAEEEASKHKDLCLLASSCLYLLPSFSVEQLQETLRRRDVNLQCAAFLGLPIEPIGRSFQCILPGHEETKPSATLAWDPKTDTLKYHDWHRRSGSEWFLLAHVYAAQFTGEADWLRGPALITWQLRLLVDASIVPPYPVRLAELPSDAPATVKRIYHGYWHLLRCKWLYTPLAPTPFTWRFAAAWCQMGERQAGEAMTWLLKHGYLRQVGTYHRMALFLPGAL
jgi:hypothetical protein